MLDFSFGELAVIGAVALVVLGPERLPKVARTVGDWVGKAQRYVNQVKTDINREMELSELKKLQEEARNAAQTFQSSVEGAVGAVEADLNKTTADLGTAYSAGTDYSWEGSGESWQRQVFPKRYKPGPSVDELAEEIARLKRQLAMPDAHAASRRKYAPRARINRARIRR
ncbi:MAG: twin-arginine translocase subunit TatB [Burkholderiales bacterium]|jgi:sec-independent protein translocase protein TatB|nr:twin-arginine translocase subunit TatB [Burkholderiales bacterium]MCA3227467.1 twin-arginine translocase subunit TatB [Burkholderiales bacterium]